MNPYRGNSSSHNRWGGDGYRERKNNTNNMSWNDPRRNEMESRAQDWERDEQPVYPPRHHDKHYMNDPDRNLQTIMKDDMNRKSRFNSPWEQERGFNQNYRNERGHNSHDRDERHQAYERGNMNKSQGHHRSNSRWEPKSNTVTDPRLDPRRSQQNDSFQRPNSESKTSHWRVDNQNYQTPRDPRWQGPAPSTRDSHQPDKSSNMSDKDMRLHQGGVPVAGSERQKYDMGRHVQRAPPPPIPVTNIPSSVPPTLPTATFQGKQNYNTDPPPFEDIKTPSSIPPQLPHSSHMPTGMQPSVPARYSHPQPQSFDKGLPKSGHQMPPQRSDPLQPKERIISPHMSPAHLSSRESSFSPPPTTATGDVDMRLGPPKSVPLSAVSKTDLSLIRKALASLKTQKTNKGEEPSESAKSKKIEDEYDPEAEWKTSQSTSKDSETYPSARKMSQDLPTKEESVKHCLKEQGIPPLPPTLPPQPPKKSTSPSLPPDPTAYSLPPPSKPTPYSNAPLVPASTSRPSNSLNNDSVPHTKYVPTSSSQSVQHSNNKRSDSITNDTNKSDKKNAKSENKEPSTTPNNKDKMLEFLNIGLPPSKKPSQSVIPGSLGDLLLKAKSKGVPKDHPSEIVGKTGMKSEETVSSKVANQSLSVSSTDIKSDNNNRKDQPNEISKTQDSKLSVRESIIEKSLQKESNHNLNSKQSMSGFDKDLAQGTSLTTKNIPLQKSVGLSQYEKSRLFGHQMPASPPQIESQSKDPTLSSEQDDLTSEPMQIDEDDSNDIASQSRSSTTRDPRMRKDENVPNIQSQDPRLLARSSGDPNRNRDPRMMTQKDPRMDNQGSHNDFKPVNDPRTLGSHRDPRQAQNFGNRDPRSQRTDPRLIANANDNNVIPPSPRYEADPPSVLKFTPNVPPPVFNPSLPPPNFNSNMKSYSGPDHRLPPPLPSYGSDNTLSTRPNMNISHSNKGNYMKDPRKFSKPQVRHNYDPGASRSNWPQQQFPIPGGVGINRSFFPQRSDVPSPGPPQPPPMHSQVNDSVDVDYAYSCLMMKGLPFFANSRYIYHFFEEFLLLDQIIEVDYKYQCKGNAYIRFSSNPVAKHAFKNLNGWLMNGHQIILKPLSIGFFNQAKNSFKAKSVEREANLGLPEMPRGNANPYYKPKPQKPPSPPPPPPRPSTPEPSVPSTQESSVSSTGQKAEDEESPIQYHGAYKDPHKKITKSFKVPKIKKNEDSSLDPPKVEKIKKESSLKKQKENVIENKLNKQNINKLKKLKENKLKKHDESSKEKKKKYKKVVIESESSSSEEEYELSEGGSTIDESDDNDDELFINEDSKKEDKVVNERKVSKTDKINKPMPKSMKEKLKLKKIKSSNLENEKQDGISVKKEKEVKRENDVDEQNQNDSDDEMNTISNEPQSDSSSELEEKVEKETKADVKDESLSNDEGDDYVLDESEVEEDSDLKTTNIVPKTMKGKKKALNEKVSVTHSKVKRMKQNAMPSKKKIVSKKKKGLLTNIDNSTTFKLDLNETFAIVLADDYVPEKRSTSPMPENYLNEPEIDQQDKSVKKIKEKSVPTKKKKVIKKNKAQLETLKESEIVSSLDLSEVFDIVLAPNYIPEYKGVTDIPDEFLEEDGYIPHVTDLGVPKETLKTLKKIKPVSKKRKNIVTDESLLDKPLKRVKNTKPVAKKKKKVVKPKKKPQKVLTKRKTRGKPAQALEPEKPVVPQSSWRSQKVTMTEEFGRKKVRVTIPMPQRMMVQLPTYDKTAIIKEQMTKKASKLTITPTEELDLVESYEQDGFYCASMEEDSESLEPQEEVMEEDSEFIGDIDNSMEVDSAEVGPH